jgi:hypothetical protein
MIHSVIELLRVFDESERQVDIIMIDIESTVNENRSINKIFIEFMNPDNYEIYRIKSMHSSILKFSIGYEVLLNQ